MPAPLDPRLPAKEHGLKEPYSTGCHALDAGAMAERLWNTYLTPAQRRVIATGWGLTDDQAHTLVVFLAALHDLAKISPTFLRQLGDADQLTGTPGYPAAPPGERLRHDRGVHLALPDLLHRTHQLPLDDRPLRLVAHQLAQILGGHHGLWHPALSHQGNQLTCPLDAAPGLGREQWDNQRAALLRLTADHLGDPVMPNRVAPAPAAVLVTGTVMLADWLVSQIGWIRARQRQWKKNPGNWTAHLAAARRAAPRALRRAQLTTAPRPKTTAFTGLFPHLAGHPLHPLQEDLEQHLPALIQDGGAGLLLVTAPTGDGKTESALLASAILAAASGASGPCILLPTMATTDAMWKRLRDHCRHLAALTGRRHPTALLHSAAWYHADYNPAGDTAHCDHATVDEWLRGRYRGLLTHACAGTWDQAATAVLPVKYNAMRWLGLSRHVVVIDEAHAYGAYEHYLTARLLEWLGALGTPVVLLSATLTGRTAASLINAYRTGQNPKAVPEKIQPAYPGWSYTDSNGTTTVSRDDIPSSRAHQLTITMPDATPDDDPTTSGSRAHALLEALAPLRDTHTGSALVVCNTVAAAQDTHQLLRATWGTGPDTPRLLLLHSQLPAHRRTAITRRIERWTGRGRTRPNRPFVVVSSPVCEQSLDVDFDLVVSDLAPAAQLLQRAGRGHRHHRTDRPTWAQHPTLVVLTPPGAIPPGWLHIYDKSLLLNTRQQLRDLDPTKTGTASLAVPQQVQNLIDSVYADDFTTPDGRAREVQDHQRTAQAAITAINPPSRVHDLHLLSEGLVDDPATRLGADSLRILPVYTQPDGTRWLNRRCTTPLPETINPDDLQTIRHLMNLTLPIRADLLQHHDPDTAPPPGWRTIGGLRHLTLLPQPTTPTGTRSYRTPTNTLHLHPTLGLTTTRR
ncbi:CRISPR-associated helicase Cas3' [Kitasatospora aureofaciens]|uniref:CRISPR-associated helicase Cas3' n=1 Tax=Kitasatospora aureofaciens TaxID=1894 RepID=UPI0033FD138C